VRDALGCEPGDDLEVFSGVATLVGKMMKVTSLLSSFGVARPWPINLSLKCGLSPSPASSARWVL